MKVGDKVKIIKLWEIDEMDTDLEVGDTGIITLVSSGNTESSDDVFDVKFDKLISDDAINYCDGAYTMCREQLEVIEAAP